MELSRGSQRLNVVLESTTQAKVAAEVGVSQQTISDWRSGNTKPKGRNGLRLLALYGIEIAEWFEPPRGNAPAPSPPTSPTPKRRTVPPPARSRPKKRAASKTSTRGARPGVKKAEGARDVAQRETG